MKKDQTNPANVWDRIEAEKRRDKMIRRVSVAAWVITGVMLLFFTVIIGTQAYMMFKSFGVGVVSGMAVMGALWPLVAVLGSVSLLIAVLSTIAVFLRLRTASLHEIQLRLAALEQMMMTKDA